MGVCQEINPAQWFYQQLRGLTMSKNLRAKSIKWLMNYYPVTADHLRDATKLECLEHSLKKWIGLTRLKSYAVTRAMHTLFANSVMSQINGWREMLCE